MSSSSTNSEASRPSASLRRLATSTLWVIAARWVIRGIGLVSTVALARILSPENFGVVAMGTLVLGLVEVLADSGQRSALVRLKAVERAHYDTAWTIGIIFGCIIAAALIAISPWVADYFREPELQLVLCAMAARPFIAGFDNIGVVDYRRDLRFDMELKLLVWPKIISFVITVAAAVVLRNHWALVLGLVTQSLCGITTSYVMHPYRPRMSLSRLHEFWAFSAWSLVGTLGRFVSERSDELVIGRRFETADLGLYTVVGSTSMMPIDELVSPPARALYSGFSRLRDDREQLRRTYLDTMGALYAVAVASASGVAALAHDIVLVLLGARWLPGVPIVPYLAFGAAAIGIATTDSALLVSVGHNRIVAIRTWALALTMLGAMFLMPPSWGLEGIAMARLAATFLLMIVSHALALHYLGIRPWPLMGRAWRPVVAGAVMTVVLMQAVPWLGSAAIPRLIGSVALGAAVYVAMMLGLWALSGRPRSIESMTIELLGSRLRAFVQRS